MLRVDYVPPKGFSIEQVKLTSAHRGLLLDKHFAPKKPNDKDGSLNQWKSLSESGLTPSAYNLAYERWLDYTSKTLDGCVAFKATIRGRMALGLGIENVHEIGCRLHATYGVPVIPGSSLKGLLHAGLRKLPDYAKLDDDKQCIADQLFGSPEARGAVDVFDAWWVPASGKSGLAPDVITVHHQSYYSKSKPPQDRESPVPNHFLSVTGQFYFSFRIAAETEQAPQWGEFVTAAAQEFLKSEGIGGKRSAGYGRFSQFQKVC